MKFLKLGVVLALFALFLGCDSTSTTKPNKAYALGLVCINGKVFREKYEQSGVFSYGETKLIPLGVDCQSGKVEIE